MRIGNSFPILYLFVPFSGEKILFRILLFHLHYLKQTNFSYASRINNISFVELVLFLERIVPVFH